MVTEIDGINLARPGRINFPLQFLCARLDFLKGSEHLSAGVENRGIVSLSRERFLPGGEQGVVRFHPLRERRTALQFAPRFLS